MTDPTVRWEWLVAILGLCAACGTAAPAGFRRIQVLPANTEAVCLEDTADGPELAFRVPPCLCPGETSCRVDAAPDGSLDVYPRLHDPGCDACIEATVRCLLPPPSGDASVPVRIDGRPAFVLEGSGGSWGPVDGCWAVPPGFAAVRIGPIEDDGDSAGSGDS